jgi:CBS domain-containing protein
MMNNALVQNWMTEKVITVSPAVSISDAHKLMSTEKIRTLVVMEKDQLVGIITRRGLLRADLSSLDENAWVKQYNLSFETVRDVMSTNVLTTTPDTVIPIVARVLLENKISSLPVIDMEKKLVGIITSSDLFRMIIQELPILKQNICIQDYMSSEVITIRPETSLLEAHRIMGVNRVRTLPVMLGNRLVGLVTRTDLMSADPARFVEKGHKEIARRIEAETVQKIMSINLMTIDPQASILLAAELMLKNKIHCLPVINDGGVFVGLLTETDLFRLIVQKFFISDEWQRGQDQHNSYQVKMN